MPHNNIAIDRYRLLTFNFDQQSGLEAEARGWVRMAYI